jgi:hypothetical protein
MQLNGYAEQQNMGALLSSLAPLLGPRIGFGQCLAPKYPSGTLFWIDPTRKPQNGDLIFYHWPEKWCEHLRSIYGLTATGGAKFYRVKKGVVYLESNEGAVPLTPDWIIEGVVTGTFTFRYPPAEFAELIARADADIQRAEDKMKQTNARTPLDQKGAVKHRGARA